MRQKKDFHWNFHTQHKIPELKSKKGGQKGERRGRMTLSNHYEAIVLGTSAGGLHALSTIIPELPEFYSLPVMVVQHLREDSDGFLVDHLNRHSAMLVKEADDKEKIQAGTMYLAPPGYHLLIEEDRSLSLSVDPRVNFSRPSIDVLFNSAADVYQSKLIGIILTGANTDGSQGLRRIKERGGLVIAQDPSSAEVDCMPQEAINATQVDQVLPLQSIGPFLRKFHHPRPVRV